MKPKQFYFVLVGILGLATLLGGFGYWLGTTKLQAGANSLKQKLTDSAIADEKLDQLNNLRAQYKELSPLIARLDAALPKTKQQSQLLLQLQSLAVSSGLNLPSANFTSAAALPSATSQTTKVGDFLALPVTFQASGSYEQMQSFLTKLERLNRQTSISALDIKRTGNKSLTFTISLNSFLKP